jgi:hypothetical protein
MKYFLDYFTENYMSDIYVSNKGSLLYPDILQYKSIKELK